MTQTAVKTAAVCNAVLNPGALQLGSAAQTPHVDLIIGSGCAWSAQSNAPWLTVAAASGTGDATLTLTLAANTTISARSGSVTANGQLIVVTQSGIPCTFTTTPATVTYTSSAQTSVLALTSLTGCVWSARSNASWLQLSPASGVGTATLTITAEANTAITARASSIAIGNLTIPVAQSGKTEVASSPTSLPDLCTSLRLQRDGDQVAPGGLTGAISFSIIASSQCRWEARSNAAWITVATGSLSTGDGTVRYLVEPNTDPQPRSGTVAVGNRTFTVNQLGSVAVSGGGGDSGGDGGGDGGGGSGSSGGDSG